MFKINILPLSSNPYPACLVCLSACIGLAIPNQAHAIEGRLVVVVDVSEQQLTVYQDGKKRHNWVVSTARRGKVTPRGRWKAKWLSRHHRSSRYNGAPMPYSIFYNGNYAIHGTNHIKRLGRPASAGCVRLHPDNAAVLFRLTKNYGLKNTIVSVVD